MKHVIFDLDGTLLDTMQASMKAYENHRETYGLPALQVPDFRRAIGYAVPEYYEKLLPDWPKEKILEFADRIEGAETEIIKGIGPTLLFPGVDEMLRGLCQEGVNIYIASTGDAGHVDAALETTGIKSLFSGIWCDQPDKNAMLEEIMSGHDKKNFVMVGDMKKDYEAAHFHGIPSIGASFGYCDKAKTRFDYYADTPMEIWTMLKTL